MSYKEYTYSGTKMIELTCDMCKSWSRKTNDDQGKLALLREGWVLSEKCHYCGTCNPKVSDEMDEELIPKMPIEVVNSFILTHKDNYAELQAENEALTEMVEKAAYIISTQLYQDDFGLQINKWLRLLE
jgi:hypothetical protein